MQTTRIFRQARAAAAVLVLALIGTALPVSVAQAAPAPPEMRDAAIVYEGGQARLSVSWGTYNPPTTVNRSIVEVSTDRGATWEVKIDTRYPASDDWRIHWAGGAPITADRGYRVRARWDTDQGLSGFSNVLRVDPANDGFAAEMAALLRRVGVTAASFAMQPTSGAGVEFASGAATVDSRFRLASLTKPITAEVIRSLATEGQLRMRDRVFCRTADQRDCHLDFGARAADPRVYDITIGHLLRHESGWTQRTFDALYADFEIAASLGNNRTPYRNEIVRYMLANQRLRFTPGAPPAGTDSYSNFGYLLASLIVESITGTGVVAAAEVRFMNLQQRIDFTEGRTLTQRPREVHYECEQPKRNVFDFNGPFACGPYGSFNLENQTGAGSMLTTASSYLDFALSFCFALDSADGFCGRNWFSGRFDGTETIARQRLDANHEAGLVLLMNKRLCGDDLADVHGLLNRRFPELSQDVPRVAC